MTLPMNKRLSFVLRRDYHSWGFERSMEYGYFVDSEDFSFKEELTLGSFVSFVCVSSWITFGNVPLSSTALMPLISCL